ncbi:E3 ubiquitin-protein ligase BRE1B [Xenoophorus captivus]|uniref:E3 ubiquitin protein ligase n=1 Tax=Xenoophorus captivus TaxID=1517983 RepID=A0ABV0RW51_9TELE
MRHLISSLQNHNLQLKGDVQRYKRKLRETQLEINKESQKEMKLLLDMYKSAPKEQRDKVQLMAAERKSKAEVEDLRMRVRELEERERKESKKLADEDALRKIRVAEETIEHLQKKLAATKQLPFLQDSESPETCRTLSSGSAMQLQPAPAREVSMQALS